MKELDLDGITNLQPVREGSREWYYAMDYPHGDLYEAEELFRAGKTVSGNDLFLVHYPDAGIFHVSGKQDGTAAGEPVYYEGFISFPAVDFNAGIIRIIRFDCRTHETAVCAEIPLAEIRDCCNLRLFEHPLTLCRQPNDGTFEMIWPERKILFVDSRESFFLRDENRLYFSIWFEDPDYREETIIRDGDTGEIIKRISGDILVMPGGEFWFLKGK